MNVEDALPAVEAGADAVGFVLAESARRVTAEQVAWITAAMPEGVERIGVFTTQDADEIFEAAALAGLTGVQLHSAFSPALVRDIKMRSEGKLSVIQVVDVDAGADSPAKTDLSELHEALLVGGTVDAVLLDTAVGGVSGGTGVAFDWDAVAAVLASRWPAGLLGKLIVAGGLRPENVGEAIARLQPWGVDVVSGVEMSKGKKDAARVREFVAAAREKVK